MQEGAFNLAHSIDKECARTRERERYSERAAQLSFCLVDPVQFAFDELASDADSATRLARLTMMFDNDENDNDCEQLMPMKLRDDEPSVLL